MSELIRMLHGPFGRISVLELNHYLVEHAHADSHMQFWLGGSRNEARVDGHPVPFNEVSAIAINSWQPHASPSFESGESCKFLLLYLRPSWLSSVCARIGVPPGFSATSFRYTEELRFLAAELAGRLEHRGGNHLVDVESRLVTLVERSLLSILAGGDGQTLSQSCEATDRRVRRSIQYMRSHINVRRNIGDVARAVGLSRPQFFTLFRQQMNISPNVFWNTIRMESSIELLIGSQIPLGELASDMGFTEPANFSRFFRMHSGVCPSSYRHAAGNEILTGPH